LPSWLRDHPSLPDLTKNCCDAQSKNFQKISARGALSDQRKRPPEHRIGIARRGRIVEIGQHRPSLGSAFSRSNVDIESRVAASELRDFARGEQAVIELRRLFWNAQHQRQFGKPLHVTGDETMGGEIDNAVIGERRRKKAMSPRSLVSPSLASLWPAPRPPAAPASCATPWRW